MRTRLVRWLGIETRPVSHAERWISGLGAVAFNAPFPLVPLSRGQMTEVRTGAGALLGHEEDFPSVM